MGSACAVRDGCSRRVIGWAVDEHMHTNLVESAVAMAVAMRGELAEAVILQPTVAISTPPASWPGSLNSTEVPMGDTITPAQALAEARDDISIARDAAAGGDAHRRGQYARSAIDSAATTLLDPDASDHEVIAARYFLREGLALGGRPDTCRAAAIDTETEACALNDDDRVASRVPDPVQVRRAGQAHGREEPDRVGHRRVARHAAQLIFGRGD